MPQPRINIRTALESEAEELWRLAYSNLAWQQFDAPYLQHPSPTLEEYRRGFFARLLEGRTALAVELAGRLVGDVSCYWESKDTRWLEAGIDLYEPSVWGHGVGRAALTLWISRLFANTRSSE